MVKSAMCSISTARNEPGESTAIARDFERQLKPEVAVSVQELTRIAPILDLFLLDSQLNVYAGERTLFGSRGVVGADRYCNERGLDQHRDDEWPRLVRASD
jgi:hypothetical protein